MYKIVGTKTRGEQCRKKARCLKRKISVRKQKYVKIKVYLVKTKRQLNPSVGLWAKGYLLEQSTQRPAEELFLVCSTNVF